MRKHVPWYLSLVALGAVCFAVLHWTYGYVIAFQSETNDCFFMSGREFLLEFLDHPGGLLRYAGRFLGQFYHYTWLGALVVSACVTCFGFVFHGVLRRLGNGASVYQTIVPCLLLLGLHTSGVYVVHDTLGLVAVCGAFLGCLCVRGGAPRRVYAVMATPITYLVLGVYVWLFVAWTVLVDWRDDRSRSGWVFRIAYLVWGVAVVLAAWRWGFMIPIDSALVYPMMFVIPFRIGWAYYTSASLITDCVLAGVLCVSLVLIPFGGWLFSGTRLGALGSGRPSRWRRVGGGIGLVGLAVLFHVIRYDPAVSAFTACRELYRHERWDALLEQAGTNPYRDLRVQFMTNIALCRQQRLLDDMFHYPQTGGPRGLVFNAAGSVVASLSEDDTPRAMYNSDLYYEMGHVNLAMRQAYNYLALAGRTYPVLKRMAQCTMVNGNRALSAKYLSLLERTLFHRDFARRYKAILADPVAQERAFGDLRKRLPTVERYMLGVPVLPLLSLVVARPDNRMAFDCLTAWCLLDKGRRSLATIAANMQGFRKAGYTSLPVHCQEALLLLEHHTRTPVDRQGFTYDEATTARVHQFYQDLPRYRAQPDGRERLRALYGDTYMFYYTFVGARADAHRPGPTRRGVGGMQRHE